jgi:glycosyltransferase involved in cell wall biosynthesis
MPHVRLLFNNLQTYGAQRVALTIAEHIPEGVQPEIVLWDDPVPPETWNGIPVISLPRGSGGFPGFARQVLSLRRLQARDPKPLIAFLTYSNLLASAANTVRPTYPLVVSEHNHTSTAMRRTDPRARIKFALMRRLYRRATAIVGVTDDVSDDLAQLLQIPRSRITTVHNPVDVARVQEAAAAASPHPWLAPDREHPVAVCPAALRRAKGQSRLLRALVAAPHWRAIFVGDGDDRRALVELAADLGIADRVAFAGFQEDPFPWMHYADVVVVPSRWEGFGLVAVEAAASGAKVVGSNAVGLGEVLRIIGATEVRQASPDDEEAFAAALATAMDTAANQPCPTYSLAGFDPAVVAHRYTNLLGVS